MRNISRVMGLLLVLSTHLLAQTGGLSGTVTDVSGAVVEGATVTVSNPDTGLTRSVTTGSTGVYAIADLAASRYTVVIDKPSFQTVTYSNVAITVAQQLTFNIQLKPALVSTEVQVQEEGVPAIELENAQLSNLVEQKQIQTLPLVTRDPYQLVLLSPGTTQTNSGLGGFPVNGSSERNNNFLLDGADNNDTSVPGIPSGLAALNPDATQEFRVITNSYAPEFGRNNGAIIDVVTKGGTNQFHGGAYEFGRYNALGARDFFNRQPDKQNPYVRNQFGYSLGGPIRKDKDFFFVNQEFQRFRTTLTEQTIVPTAAFKTAVFTFQGQKIDLRDPSSPNNVLGLPLDPATQKMFTSFPDPVNGTPVDDIRSLINFPSSSKQNVDNVTLKLDHRFTENHGLSVRWAYDTLSDPNPFHDDLLPAPNGIGLGSIGTRDHVYNLAATFSSTLKATLINEARFGWNKNENPFFCNGTAVFNSLGNVDQFGRGSDLQLPDLTNGGFPGFGCTPLGDSDSQTRRTGTWSGADNVSMVKGTHLMKFGSEFRLIYEKGFNSFSSRNAAFLQPFKDSGGGITVVNTCTDASSGACQTLQDMSAVLLGLVDFQFQNQFFDKGGNRTPNDLRNFRQHEYGFFWQDSWKIRPNFTFNYGLRYQFNGVPYEINNNISNLYVDASGPAPFTFQLAGPGTGRLLYNNDFSNIEPRLGLAWDPFKKGKTSIRAGFGIFHDRLYGNLFGNLRGNPPFTTSGFNQPLLPFETAGLPPLVPPSPVVKNGAEIFPGLIDTHFRMAYSESWNFGVEHQLPARVIVNVNYVGNQGHHILRVVDGNPPDPVLVNELLAAGVPPDQLQFSNLYNGAELGVLPFDAVHNNAFFSPFGAGAAFNRSIGNSHYNALQMQVTKNLTHGFQVQGAYTWSHSIDDVQDPLAPTEGSSNFPVNSRKLFEERGNSNFDIHHRAVINFVYELPLGKGKGYLNSGILGKVFQGWQLSGITTLQTGHPFDIFSTVDSEHTSISGRADLVGSPDIPHGATVTETGPPVSAFANPPFGRAGDVGRNNFYGPSYKNVDAVMSKLTSIGERVKLESRFEVYNLFNRVQFDLPGHSLSDPQTFGFSTSTLTRADATTSARQIQIALKLSF